MTYSDELVKHFMLNSNSKDSLTINVRNNMPFVCKRFNSDLNRASLSINKQRYFNSMYTKFMPIKTAEILDFQKTTSFPKTTSIAQLKSHFHISNK